jgi:hypothetical protein
VEEPHPDGLRSPVIRRTRKPVTAVRSRTPVSPSLAQFPR